MFCCIKSSVNFTPLQDRIATVSSVNSPKSYLKKGDAFSGTQAEAQNVREKPSETSSATTGGCFRM